MEGSGISRLGSAVTYRTRKSRSVWTQFVPASSGTRPHDPSVHVVKTHASDPGGIPVTLPFDSKTHLTSHTRPSGNRRENSRTSLFEPGARTPEAVVSLERQMTSDIRGRGQMMLSTVFSSEEALMWVVQLYSFSAHCIILKCATNNSVNRQLTQRPGGQLSAFIKIEDAVSNETFLSSPAFSKP